MSKNNDTVSKSYFIVLNNPAEHGYTGSPEEVCQRLTDEWVSGSSTRTCAWAYCVSADGLHHLHGVLEDSKSMRFSAVKKAFPSAHIEGTKGNKAQAEAYIQKAPPYDEKGEVVLTICRHGEIQGRQGNRTDLQMIQSLIDGGMKPGEIMATNIEFRRYEKIIRSAFFAKRVRETPVIRDVSVHYHVGQSGSGKSYEYVRLCKTHGEDEIYFLTDMPTSGGLDMYQGEGILFWDELKPTSVPLHTLLTMLDCYKAQIHCRYQNVFALWNEVHLTSVYSPEALYQGMVAISVRHSDPIDQLFRRITDITYHEKTAQGDYWQFTLPMTEYKEYSELIRAAHEFWGC